MRIVRARPEDAGVLTEIAFEAKRQWGYPESWIKAWARTLVITPAYITSFPTFAAVADDEIVGFCSIRMHGEEARMEHLWVRSMEQGRGVGRLLFRHCEMIARRDGAAVLRIESDPNAEGFYLEMGATAVGRVPAHVEGVERYLPLMEKSLD
jgi:GNAT superfamily N-acetyltransferase